MDTRSTQEMNIGLTIQNTQLIQLIQTLAKTMTPQQVNQHLETLLTIGHLCSEMGKRTLTCDPYIEPLQQVVSKQSQSVDEMKQVFDTLLSCRNNSSRKGQLSEIISIQKLQCSFPESEFVDTSKTPHSGDCHGTIGSYRILYEFKDYSCLVPKKEIVKFHRDLKASGFRLGVFCSNLSGITGKNSIDWELLDTHTVAVYVSGMGMSGYGSVVGTQLLLALISAMVYDSEKGYVMRNDICWEKSLQNFCDLVDEYSEYIRNYDSVMLRLSETKDTLHKALLPLEKELYIHLHKSETIFRKMTQLQKSIKLEIVPDVDRIVFEIEDFMESVYEIHEPVVRKFCEYVQNKDIQLSCQNDVLIGYCDQQIKFKTHQTKTRIDIMFPIGTERFSCNPRLECVKSNHIVITLKDTPDIWSCLLERL